MIKAQTRKGVTNMIAKVVRTIIGIVAFLSVLGWAGNLETHYSRQAVITAVKGNEVVVLDNTDNVWAFKGDGYKVGDEVTLKMFTNYTDDNIYDDEIVSVKVLDK